MFSRAGIGQTITEVQLSGMPSAFAEAGERAHGRSADIICDGDNLDRSFFNQPVVKRLCFGDLDLENSRDVHHAFEPDMRARVPVFCELDCIIIMRGVILIDENRNDR